MFTKEEVSVYYVADFEAADNRALVNKEEDIEAWVWLWSVTKCEDMSSTYGRDIDSFFKYIFSIASENYTLRVNFHNLKYDGCFILDWLISHNFEEKEALRSNNKYRTLIDAEGNFFHITVRFNKCNICFEDSLKKIPLSVEELAEALKLDNKKGKIDYSRIIYPTDDISQEDIDYCINDTKIVAEALQKMLYNNGLYKLTASSNAMYHFTELKHCDFRRRYPALSEEEDTFVRQAYKGGLCLTNGVEDYTGDIYILDRNSMYPACMYDYPLPIGEGIHFEGKYKEDKLFPLYVARIYVTMKVKPNCFPCIGEKSFYNSRQDFITECIDKELYVTNIDLEAMYDNYDIEDIDFMEGYKYACSYGVFCSYIDYWYNVKQEAKANNDNFRYLLAKIMLNSLYGRFGMRIISGKQRLGLNDEGILTKTDTKVKKGNGVYIPVAAFTTAYARRDLLREANKLGGRSNVLYMDTDSLHTINPNYANVGINIDSYKLGAWKLEGVANRGIYIRQKTYAELINNEWVIKCAGLSKKAKSNITDIDMFKKGKELAGNLKQRRVKGGCILEQKNFIIK